MARGNIETRGPNQHRIRVFLGTDENGKRKYHRETVNGPKKAAEARLTEILRELDTGGFVEPAKITFGELLKRWDRDYAQMQLSPTTAARYRSIIERHLLPALGHVPLARLRPADLQLYYAEAERGGRLDGRGRKLSPSTVRKHHALIHRALQVAVKWGLIARNVASVVEPPSPRQEKPTVWTAEQVERFLAFLRDHRMLSLYATAVMTGMRRGELFGLSWDDVDLEGGWIRVRSSRLMVEGRIEASGTKTPSSERSVAISARLVSILRHYRSTIAQEKLLLGERYNDNQYVFRHVDGTPSNPSNVSKRQFPALCKSAGVPRIRFHDLRHTHATLLLQAGVHPKVVSERLGHSSIRVTMDTYSHVLPSTHKEAADSFERLLSREA